MKRQPAFDKIPEKEPAAAVCAALLAVWGILIVAATTFRPWLGGIAAGVGVLLGALAVLRIYGAVVRSNRNLERACRTRLLEKFLSGDVPPDGDLTEAMPGVCGDYFAVATMQCIDFTGYLPGCTDEHIPNTAFQQVDNWMRESISARLAGISQPYFVPILDGMDIIINVTGLDETDLDASSRRKAGEICAALSLAVQDLEARGLICGAVLSTVCSGRQNIFRARQEAEDLTSYAELMGDATPVKNGYDKAENPTDLSDKLLRTEQEKRFMQAVTNRNFDQLSEIIDGFVDLELRTASRYPDLIKSRLVMRMEQLLSAFSISPLDYDAAEAEVVAQFRLLTDVKSAQRLREQCQNLIQALKDYEESETRQRSDKVSRALAFIEAHYDDPNICAEMIGEELGVSASYVSRMLRQNTGLGVVDHIHGARLQRAKALLEKTDLSLDDIASQVGFSSRFTLTRSFKRYEEMTPGAWRELRGSGSSAV